MRSRSAWSPRSTTRAVGGQSPRQVLKMEFLALLLVTFSSSLRRVLAVGGEKVYFTTPQMAPNISHRQNVCDRYESYRNRTVQLEDALEGLKLHVHISNLDQFNYNEETGIDKEYPGILAKILDELARRGQFTWRDSFGANHHSEWTSTNATLDETLSWYTQVYDLDVNWWTPSTERMRNGVTFLEPMLESSPILIGKRDQNMESDSGINIWGWLKPYDLQVWMMTIFTILLSGVVYQVLEWFADERDERSMWEWWMENAYLSAINFTQAYEYQPKTLASRIFGISMAIWALVMTATYTANLASLLVVQSPPIPGPKTLAEVAVYGNNVCTYEGSYADTFIRNSYADVVRIQSPSYQDAFQKLRDGICDFAVVPVSLWNRAKARKAFNPQCDLIWVGGDRRISQLQAGFASKADSGDLCTSFIQDVLNVHIRDMVDSGFMISALEWDHKLLQDIDCNAHRAGASAISFANEKEDPNSRRRNLLVKPDILDHHRKKNGQRMEGKLHRGLKGGGKGAAGAAVASAESGGGSLSEDERKLSVEEMIGTFVFHWGLMAVALVIAGLNAIYDKHSKRFAPKTPETKTGPVAVSCPTNSDWKGGEHEVEGRTPFEQQLSGLESRLMCELNDLRQQIQMMSKIESSVNASGRSNVSTPMKQQEALKAMVDVSSASNTEVMA